MADNDPIFDLRKKEDNLLLGFAAGVGGLSVIGFAGLPLLSIYLLLGLATCFFLSFDRLQNPQMIPAPDNITLDQDIKLFVIAGIIGFGLYFSFIAPLSQILIGVIGSIALGVFFVSECVVLPQKKLNEALQQAVRAHELENVVILLSRNADPFACDETSNNCFHLAISDHETSKDILNALFTHQSQEKLTFKSVLLTLRDFRNNDIQREFGTFYAAIKIFLRLRTQENREAIYEAGERFLNALEHPLRTLFTKSLAYLQQYIENENNKSKTNQAGNTPLEMIALMIPEPSNAHRLELEACFRQWNELTEQIDLDAPSISPNPLQSERIEHSPSHERECNLTSIRPSP